MRKIVIAGGTGFIGRFLAHGFKEIGDEVIIISRNNGDVSWGDKSGAVHAVNNADLILNLAGRSVDCRYNETNKNTILRSRVDTTHQLGNAILACTTPPKLWINSSTATIYRHAEDRPMTEEHGEIGKGFSVNVAKQWEKAFFDFKLPKTRQVALRMAIVLGKQSGVVKPLEQLVKLGLGGRQGNGNQMFSWIHIDDLFQIVLFLMQQGELSGVFNCSAPGPVSNKILMQLMRDTLHIKLGLPTPAWLLEIGAVLIRTETELILKSRWVLPDRLTRAGYTFTYPTLEPALGAILR